MVEKVIFAFRRPPKEFEVRKVKADRINDTYGSWFGKTRWRVEKISVPGISVKVGDVLSTGRVYQIARTIDRKAAHQFDMYNPKKRYDTREEE
jgi:hypothetical protein